VKVGGEALYKKARRGEAQEGEERPVTVYRADLVESDEDSATFEVECSSGTYVRQLVTALGDAYCDELRRTAIGPFSVDDADPEIAIPVARALAFLPEHPLGEEEASRVAHGVRVPGAAEGPIRLTHAGELVAIAEPRDGELQPVVVFAG
jgi:tRNA pseudouridine55 synthase